MKRRLFLMGGAVAVVGVSPQPSVAQYAPDKRPSTTGVGISLAPSDIDGAVTRLRDRFSKEFNAEYVENVILPHFLVATYEGERLQLPMIGVELTKENALP